MQGRLKDLSRARQELGWAVGVESTPALVQLEAHGLKHSDTCVRTAAAELLAVDAKINKALGAASSSDSSKGSSSSTRMPSDTGFRSQTASARKLGLDSCIGDVDADLVFLQPDNDSKENEGRTSQTTNSSGIRDAPAEKKDPYTIDERSFMVLPDSTRGRAKLRDAQITLTVIVSAMSKKSRKNKDIARGGSAKPLSIKELDALGGKCVGLTGSSVLASLRALGYIEVGRDGITLNSK